jgi:phosphatidate cytidylyltransferase
MTGSTPVSARKSDLGIRSVTGIALILVALFCVIYGQEPYWILLSVAALVMTAEWCGLVKAERWQMWLALIGVAFSMLLLEPHIDVPTAAGLDALLAAGAVVALLTRKVKVVAGMFYSGLPTVALSYIHDQPDGIDLTLWTMIIVWATDIGAYFAGRAIGGPKLAPKMSPNKTWAGLIGGMIAATAIGFALTTVLHVQLRLAAFTGLLAVAAQIGDLFESQMKRSAGVKDSGRILPGHGGVMDRLDGLVPVACIVSLILLSGVI